MYTNDYRHADPIFVTDIHHTLWLGDCQAAEDIAWLKENNIKTVITAAYGFNLRYDPSIKHIVYEIVDVKSHKISNYFDIAAYQIHKSLKIGSVLLHCGAGVSRSASLAVAYLIRNHNMSFKEALRYCKAKRPQICPNLGFELQLKQYEKKIMMNANQSGIQWSSTSQKQKKCQSVYGLQHKSFIIRDKPVKTNRTKLVQSSISKDGDLIHKISIKQEECERKRQLGWLTKIAEFRFGSTNLKNWHLTNKMQRSVYQG